MQKIGVAIIGLGVIAERLMPVFESHEKTKLVGGFDVDIKRVNYMKEKFGLKGFDTYQDLINDEDVHMVYVAVPPQYHEEIALMAMEAGKHVFCEKPLAGTLDEALKISQKALETGLVNGMNFPLYYGFAYESLRKLLDNKTLGKIKRIDLTGVFPVWPRPWQQNQWIDTKLEGGFTREIFTHYVQLIHDAFGKVVNIETDVDYDNGHERAETQVLARGQIGDIKVMFSGLTFVDRLENLNMTIYGEKGTFEIVNWRDVYLAMNGEDRKFVEPEAKTPTYDLIDNLYKAIEGKDNRLVSFQAGYHVTEVIETILK